MSGAITNREAEARLWERYRPALEYLFMVQNRTRNEIRDLMATNLGFDRSPSQYDARFKKWGFRKNFNQEEWKRVDLLEDERKRIGRPSVIENDGRVVKRAPNRRHRYHETTLERIQREMMMQIEGCKSTPLSNRGNQVTTVTETQLALVPRTPSPKPCGNEYIKVSETLWYSCLNPLNDLFKITYQAPTRGVPHYVTDIVLREISRTVSQKSYNTNFSILNSYSRQTLKSRLLESPCASVIDIENTIALRTGQAFLDLIKLALYLISNNIAQGTGIGPVIVAACQMPTTGKVLEHLLQQNIPMVQAFADGLLHYASRANDRKLIETLIRSGISPNSQCVICNECRLECAIFASAEQAANTLLEFGADADRNRNGKTLRISYEFNLISIVKELLQRGVGSNARWKMSENPYDRSGWDIMSTAALYGGISAVETLTHHHPLYSQQAVEADASHAFILAVSVGNEILARYWMKNYNISTRSCAIGLCGAAANGRINMVELLLSHGTMVDGEHGTIHYCCNNIWDTIYCDITALEVALGNGHFSTAKLLIDHGANAKIKTPVLNRILSPLFGSDNQLFPDPVGTLQSIQNFNIVEEPKKFAWYSQRSMMNERMEVFKKCLDLGAEPDGGTLVWLSFAGALNPLRSLVERGLSLDAKTTVYFTISRCCMNEKSDVNALTAALYAGNDDVVEYLLENGANIHILAGKKGIISPLAASIIQGRPDWTKMLMCSGASPKDPMALWAAAHTDNLYAYDALRIACKDIYGHGIADYALPAASEAISRGNMVFLRAIVERGIKINDLVAPWLIKSGCVPASIVYDHPLIIAVQTLDLSAVQLLLGIGANPNIGDNIHYSDLDDIDRPLGTTPILVHLQQYGFSGDTVSIAKALIEAGAIINYPRRTKCINPLAFTIMSGGPLALVELLVQKGAFVDAMSISYNGSATPLCAAVSSGRYRVVKLLLAKGASVSGLPVLRRDLVPKTPIQCAASYGRLEILKLLLEAFEDGSQFISEYPLALRLAQRAGHRAVVYYLQAHHIGRFSYLRGAADEVILTNLEDKQEDKKYWYEFWKDERYEMWETIHHDFDYQGNHDYIRKMYSKIGSNVQDLDSESDGNFPDTMFTTSCKDHREMAPDTDDGVDDLDLQRYFDFDMAQYHPDTESCGQAIGATQISVSQDHRPFEDAMMASISNIDIPVIDDVRRNLFLNLDGQTTKSNFGDVDAMLEEQIWDADGCIGQQPWEHFHTGEVD